MAVQLLILAVILLIVPTFIGGVFSRVDKMSGNLLFRWVSGQFLLWAGFQFISTALIVQEKTFGLLVWLFWGYIAALLLLAAAQAIRHGFRKSSVSVIRGFDRETRSADMALWAVFGGLLLFQLIQAARLAYADGDDAYYVAIAATSPDDNLMYCKLPYTGGGTSIDVRHGLAPFPIWISFLAKASGMQAVTIAHVVLPVVLIFMSYSIYYLLGVRLFEKGGSRLPLFLIFAELLVLFGDYSFYTVENFMIARSRQGKAALGSIVIPFLFLLLLILTKKLQEGERIPAGLYLLIGMGAAAACLCSTLGALLICVLLGVGGLAAALCYRRFQCLLPLALCCVPCVGYALLYLALA